MRCLGVSPCYRSYGSLRKDLDPLPPPDQDDVGDIPPQLAELPADVRGWPWGWYLSRPDTFFVWFMFLLGSEMDYVDDKFQSGFVFTNPNEKGRCGCGESFSVEAH